MNIDDFVTHNFDGLDKVNDSISALHSGDCLRAVVEINKYNLQSTESFLRLQKVGPFNWKNAFEK